MYVFMVVVGDDGGMVIYFDEGYCGLGMGVGSRKEFVYVVLDYMSKIMKSLINFFGDVLGGSSVWIG